MVMFLVEGISGLKMGDHLHNQLHSIQNACESNGDSAENEASF